MNFFDNKYIVGVSYVIITVNTNLWKHKIQN